ICQSSQSMPSRWAASASACKLGSCSPPAIINKVVSSAGSEAAHCAADHRDPGWDAAFLAKGEGGHVFREGEGGAFFAHRHGGHGGALGDAAADVVGLALIEFLHDGYLL